MDISFIGTYAQPTGPYMHRHSPIWTQPPSPYTHGHLTIWTLLTGPYTHRHLPIWGLMSDHMEQGCACECLWCWPAHIANMRKKQTNTNKTNWITSHLTTDSQCEITGCQKYKQHNHDHSNCVVWVTKLYEFEEETNKQKKTLTNKQQQNHTLACCHPQSGCYICSESTVTLHWARNRQSL